MINAVGDIVDGVLVAEVKLFGKNSNHKLQARETRLDIKA